jgi:hypothetical protein
LYCAAEAVIGGGESSSGCTDTTRSYLHCEADMWRMFMSVQRYKQAAVYCIPLWWWAGEIMCWCLNCDVNVLEMSALRFRPVQKVSVFEL